MGVARLPRRLNRKRCWHRERGGELLCRFPIPKGLWPPAQGCEERATLGYGSEMGSTATRLRQISRRRRFNPAQGCEERATRGIRRNKFTTATELWQTSRAIDEDGIATTPVGWIMFCWTVTQGSSCLATLGFGTESRWDSRVARWRECVERTRTSRTTRDGNCTNDSGARTMNPSTIRERVREHETGQNGNGSVPETGQKRD